MILLIPIIFLAGVYAYITSSPPLPSFTLYYSNNCSYCKPILPIFTSFQYPGVTIRTVEARWNREMVVQGYPTFVYRDLTGTPTVYDGERSKQGWESFLATK